MIIHSIVPIELIFQNDGSQSGQRPVQFEYMGQLVEAIPSAGMSYTITRVLSTSPKAYLNPMLQPGKEIRLHSNKKN